MGSTEAINGDSPLTRLTDFLKAHPDVKYLRLVTAGYSGAQLVKNITIHHARLIAASARTLRPGEEVAPAEGKEGVDGADERGVILGSPTHVACMLLATSDTGALNIKGIEDGEMTTQIDWMTLSPLLCDPSYAYVAVSLYKVGPKRTKDYGYDRDPRVVLQRTVDKAKEKQIEFQMGVEIEFALFDEKDLSGPITDPRTSVYGNLFGSKGYKILEEIVDTLEYAGVHVWSFHAEDGHNGVYELQLLASDPVKQADQATFAFHVIRTIATKHSCIATLAVLPVAGSTIGRHIHTSLSRPDQDMHFIAGLMEHMPELSVVLQASIDSYTARKLHSGGAYIFWGTNKGNPINLRHPGRFELRVADCHFNIHLQMSAVIAAGMDGVDKQLMPKQTDPIAFEHLIKYAFAHADSAVKEEYPKKYNFDHIPLPKDLGEAIEKFKAQKEFWDQALGEKVEQGILLVQEGKWKKVHDMTKEERRVKSVQVVA